MHTDVELRDSPSRQHVLEDELSRQPAIKIFQYSHARLGFLFHGSPLFTRTRMNLLACLSLHLLSNVFTVAEDSQYLQQQRENSV